MRELERFIAWANSRCLECGATEDLHFHHVVPRALGGRRTVALCEVCHGKVHGRNMTRGGELTARALRDLKAQGRVYSRVIPFGQAAVDGRLVPAPEELETLAYMRELASTNPSATAVARALNAAGKLNRGRPWVRATVSYLLARAEPANRG